MLQHSRHGRWTLGAVALLTALGAFRLFLTTRFSLIPDECYYWLWSKFPDWCYFSKGPMVAWAIRLGTAVGGDTELGVRWPAVALHVATGWLFFSFARRLFGERAGFWTLFGAMTVPLFAVGGIVMTIDPLSVFFWAAAVVAGWGACQRPGWGNWLLVGALIGLGFLSKFTNALQGLCLGLFLLLTREGRAALRTPKPWAGGALALAMTAPFWIWNVGNGWVTFGHLAHRGSLDRPFRVSPSEFSQFLGLQALVFSPLVWVCVVVAVVWGLWRVGRDRGWRQGVVTGRWRDSRILYLLCQSVPLFGFFGLFAWNEAGQPNWTVPGYFAAFILAGGLWHAACLRRRRLRAFVAVALGLSLVMTALLHDTRPLRLRPEDDPLSRARGWDEAARRVAQAMDQTGADFVIANHYAIASALTWHLRDRGFGPKRRVFTPRDPGGRVYNQLDLWPSYEDKAGRSAIFVSTGKGTPDELRKQFGSFEFLTKPEWIEEDGLPVMRLRLSVFRDFRGLGQPAPGR